MYKISSWMIDMLHYKVLQVEKLSKLSTTWSIQHRLFNNWIELFHDQIWKQTCSRGSFITALILSLEVAPSGQSNLPLRTYFSACRLIKTRKGNTGYFKINKMRIIESSHGKLLTQLSSTSAAVMDQEPSPSWQDALNFRESETKLPPAVEAYKLI